MTFILYFAFGIVYPDIIYYGICGKTTKQNNINTFVFMVNNTAANFKRASMLT